MNRHRMITWVIAILFVAPLAYLGINSVNPLGSSGSGVFSRDRILADRFLDKKEWAQADFHLRKILAVDPQNGHALNCHTYCLKAMRRDLRSQLRHTELDADSRANLEQQFSDLGLELIEPLKKQANFFRFRSRALVDLAVLYTSRDDWNAAMDCLDGYLRCNPLRDVLLAEIAGLGTGGREMIEIDDQELKDRFPQLEPDKIGLHRFARFWDLVDLESRIREENGYPVVMPLSPR